MPIDRSGWRAKAGAAPAIQRAELTGQAAGKRVERQGAFQILAHLGQGAADQRVADRFLVAGRANRRVAVDKQRLDIEPG